MCFFTQQTKKAQELENRFHAKFKEVDNYRKGWYNCFEHPNTPVITNQNQESIQLFQWGLIPSWAKNADIQKYTINARWKQCTKKWHLILLCQHCFLRKKWRRLTNDGYLLLIFVVKIWL
jgi:putative SOS response-associated peptidase YedK